MIESKLNIYRELQKHLDTFSIGFPSTKSGVELRILTHLFSPEEAKIALYLRFSFSPIEYILDRMEKNIISLKELEKILDKMVKKSCINLK